MTLRRTAVLAAAVLLLAGCSSDVVPGSPDTDSGTSSAPCAKTASAAPQCAPSPTTTAPSAASPTPGDPATFARYARQPVSSRLGDPGLINVCRIAGAGSTAGSITLTPPASARAAACSFELAGSGVPAGSSASVMLSQTAPYPDPKPTVTTVRGFRVLKFPYEAATGNCRRAVVLTQSGAVTAVTFSGYAKGLSAARMCGLGDTVIGRFAAAASDSGAKVPLSTANPSLLSLDACKVAAAAGLTNLPAFTGAKASPTDFAAGCELETDAGRTFTISSGVLRDPTAKPEGTAQTVDGHPLYGDIDDGGSCTVTSRQAKGEILTMSTSAAQLADVPTCDAMVTALGEYLHVLQLR